MTSQPAAHPKCNEVYASKIKSLCGQYVDLMCTKIAFLCAFSTKTVFCFRTRLECSLLTWNDWLTYYTNTMQQKYAWRVRASTGCLILAYMTSSRCLHYCHVIAGLTGDLISLAINYQRGTCHAPNRQHYVASSICWNQCHY